MLDGPPIELERAKEIYRLYTCLFGSQQSLARIAERGGFGHEEVFLIEKKHAAEKARGRCTCANVEMSHEPERRTKI